MCFNTSGKCLSVNCVTSFAKYILANQRTAYRPKYKTFPVILYVVSGFFEHCGVSFNILGFRVRMRLRLYVFKIRLGYLPVSSMIPHMSEALL